MTTTLFSQRAAKRARVEEKSAEWSPQRLTRDQRGPRLGTKKDDGCQRACMLAVVANDAPIVIHYLKSETWLYAFHCGASLLATALKHNSIDVVAALLEYDVRFDRTTPAVLEAAARLPGDAVLALLFEHCPDYVACWLRMPVNGVAAARQQGREYFGRWLRQRLAVASALPTPDASRRPSF